jgi:signal transduction histidine kinase/CheY-like chemotaxis protein
MTIFGNMYFAYDWRFAIFNQIVAHSAMTSFLAYRFLADLSKSEYYSPLINVNVLLLILPFFFYFTERDKRQIAFHAWETHRETQFWEQLLRELPVGLVIANARDIVYVNKYASELLGCITKDDESRIQGALKQVRKQDDRGRTLTDTFLVPDFLTETDGGKYTCPMAGGEERAVAVTLSTQEKDHVNYKICIMQDQRLLEELEQVRLKIKLQKSFFATITHELRNPLHGLMGFLEIFKLSPISAELQRNCAIAINTGKLMMSLINDILDSSQIEVNNLTLAGDWHNFIDAAEECLAIMRPQYERKHIRLLFVHEPCIPHLYNDRRRYTQIVINLLSNALKFTRKGSVNVNISYDPGQRQLITSVADTGIGISATNIPRLFQAYGKVSTTQENPQGVGLGLFICKRLAEQMGGYITVKSTIESISEPAISSGSVFTFAIKSLREEEESKTNDKGTEVNIVNVQGMCNGPESATRLQPDPKDSFSLAPLVTKVAKVAKEPFEQVRALVVDDDMPSAMVLQQFCQALKIQVEVAASGEEALDMATRGCAERRRDETYRLFFVDLHMPGIDGIQTAIQLTQLYRLQDLPISILGLSGDSDQETKESCLQAGMLDLLVKPFTQRDLSRILQRIFA